MKPNPILCLALVLGGFDSIARADDANPPGLPIEFQSLHMIDRKQGWAQNNNVVFLTNDWVFEKNAIFKTADGGRSWKTVFCSSPDENVSSFFYDRHTAWVTTVSDKSNSVAVLRTTDGGNSWKRAELRQAHPFEYYCFLSFSKKDKGWLMLIPEHGMNSSPGDLYETDDSGANWRLVNNTDGSPYEGDNYTQAEFESRHPFLLCAGPVTRQDAANGWLLGSMTTTTPSFLFATRDAGQTWQLQKFPLPPSLHDGGITPSELPHFFGKDGIVGASFRPTNDASVNDCAVIIYTTHNRGLTWQPATPVKFSGVWDFISARTGWLWSFIQHNTGSTAPVTGTLYRTGDGGKTWQAMPREKGLEPFLTHGQDIVQLDFVDNQCGWAIARDKNNFTQLLQTADGGKTWNCLPAVFK